MIKISISSGSPWPLLLFGFVHIRERSMRKFFLALTIICCMSISLAAQESSNQVIDLLPRSDFAPGWRWDAEPQVYGPINLYDYIDGEAELYNDYNFVRMATVSYVRVDNSSQTFTLDIYDMGSPLNAFGIYGSYRRPELEFDKIGEEAIVSDLNIRFYKGQHFVLLNAGSTESLVVRAMREAAVLVASTIPAAVRPAELSLLPAKDQVAHSLKYVTKGFLGQSAFKAGLQADYTLPSGMCTVFLVFNDGPDQASEAIQKYQASLVEQGTVTSFVEGKEKEKLIAQAPYQGNIIAMRHAGYIVGVYGYKRQKEAEGLMEKIVSGLK
jgi:hypothetical protein